MVVLDWICELDGFVLVGGFGVVVSGWGFVF